MGTDIHADYLKRRSTPGSADHFIWNATRVWDAAEDRHGLPKPLTIVVGVYESQRSREPFAQVVTPEVARALGEAAERDNLHDGFLLVNAAMPADQFERERRRAIRAVGRKRRPKRRTVFERGRWLDLLLLYLHELAGDSPPDLAARFLFDGKPHEFHRNDANRRKLTQAARDGIRRARTLIRGLGQN